MNTPTLEDIRRAMSMLGPKDKTKSGAYKIGQLNNKLGTMGLERTTAERRDMAAAGYDDPPAGMVEVTLQDATSNPVALYIHGLGHFSIRIGETKKLPKESVELLERQAGTEFEVKE